MTILKIILNRRAQSYEKILVLIFLFFIPSLFSQEVLFKPGEKIKLYLKPIQSEVLTKQQKISHLKSAFQVILKKRQYQVLLGILPPLANQNQATYHSVEIQIGKKKEYFLTALLKDESNNEILKKVNRKMIPKLNLSRAVYIAVEKLFEDIVFKEMESYTENLNEKTRKKRKVSRAKKRREAEKKKPIRKAPRVAKELNEKRVAVKVPKPKKKIKRKEKSLKENIDQYLAKNKSKIRDKFSDKEDNEADDFVAERVKKDFLLSLNLYRSQIDTTDFELVHNTFTGVRFGVWGNIIKFKNSSFNANFSIGTLVRNTDEYDIPPYYKAGLNYSYLFSSFNSVITAGVDYETYSFINIPVFGRGFQTAKNKMIWAKLRGDIYFKSLRNLNLSLLYAKSLSSSLSYGPGELDPMSGNFIEASLSVIVFKTFRAGFSYQKLALDGKSYVNPLSADENQLSLVLSYLL